VRRLAGKAVTARAGPCVAQLVKHWSHKFAVVDESGRVRIELPRGEAILGASGGHIDIELAAPDERALARLKEVLVRHLDRFAFREGPLSYAWTVKSPS